jgi:hypothetical protein
MELYSCYSHPEKSYFAVNSHDCDHSGDQEAHFSATISTNEVCYRHEQVVVLALALAGLAGGAILTAQPAAAQAPKEFGIDPSDLTRESQVVQEKTLQGIASPRLSRWETNDHEGKRGCGQTTRIPRTQCLRMPATSKCK